MKQYLLGDRIIRRLSMHRSNVGVAVITLALVVGCNIGASPANAQQAGAKTEPTRDDVETEIKRLEQVEVKAVLAKDAKTLEKLWDARYVVNSPDNRVVLPGKTVVDRPVMNKPRTAFSRDVEHVTVRDNIAISMGSEALVPAGNLPKAGQTVKRRYTNIWMRIEGDWKLVARHANEICTN